MSGAPIGTVLSIIPSHRSETRQDHQWVYDAPLEEALGDIALR